MVLVNNNYHEIDRHISVWEMGMHKNTTMSRVMLTYDGGYTTEEEDIFVERGFINVHMPPLSAMVIVGNDALQNESPDSLFALGVPDIDIPEDAMNMRFLAGQEPIRDKSFTDMKRREKKRRKEKELKLKEEMAKKDSPNGSGGKK